MNNYPPFFVGQEVVCVLDHSQGLFKKGQEFVVFGVMLGCCEWEVNIGIKNRRSIGSITLCGCCGKSSYWTDDIWWLSSSCFAPKDQFKAISFTKVMETELTSVN